jgi:hypothetical protein
MLYFKRKLIISQGVQFETKHKGQYNYLTGQLRNNKISSLKSSLCQQQNILIGTAVKPTLGSVPVTKWLDS